MPVNMPRGFGLIQFISAGSDNSPTFSLTFI